MYFPSPEYFSLTMMKRKLIIDALRACGGNKQRAAELLEIGRTTLYRKMKELEIQSWEWVRSPTATAGSGVAPCGDSRKTPFSSRPIS